MNLLLKISALQEKISREKLKQVLMEYLRGLGYEDVKIIRSPVESVEMSPTTARVYLPTAADLPALFHEIGHLEVFKRFPFLTTLSEYTFPLVALSPLLAGGFLWKYREAFQKNPLLYALIALAIWKFPNIPRFIEEYLASHYGQRLAKTILYQDVPVIRKNIQPLLTYFY